MRENLGNLQLMLHVHFLGEHVYTFLCILGVDFWVVRCTDIQH